MYNHQEFLPNFQLTHIRLYFWRIHYNKRKVEQVVRVLAFSIEKKIGLKVQYKFIYSFLIKTPSARNVIETSGSVILLISSNDFPASSA